MTNARIHTTSQKQMSCLTSPLTTPAPQTQVCGPYLVQLADINAENILLMRARSTIKTYPRLEKTTRLRHFPNATSTSHVSYLALKPRSNLHGHAQQMSQRRQSNLSLSIKHHLHLPLLHHPSLLEARIQIAGGYPQALRQLRRLRECPKAGKPTSVS